jgi:hypothetical protein
METNFPDNDEDLEESANLNGLLALRHQRDERLAQMLQARLNLELDDGPPTEMLPMIARRVWALPFPPQAPPPPPPDVIPKEFLREVEELVQHLRQAEEASTAEHECALCLTIIEIQSEHAQLALCRHVFHKTCYEDLVRDKTSCPVCRGGSACVLKPIAGVLPLSQNGRHSKRALKASE